MSVRIGHPPVSFIPEIIRLKVNFWKFLGCNFEAVRVADCYADPCSYSFSLFFNIWKLLDGRPFVELNEEIFVSLDPKNEAKKVSFAVQEGGTLEVTLARFWSSDGFGGAKWDIEFGGVNPTSKQITLGAHPVHLELKASVPETISPTTKFERVCLPLVPSDFAITKVFNFQHFLRIDLAWFNYV